LTIGTFSDIHEKLSRKSAITTLALACAAVILCALGHVAPGRIARQTDPNIALALIVIGVLSIYVEFCSPGAVVPAMIGSILVLLGLSSLYRLPLNWWGAALILIGLVLLALQAKVSAYGVPALCGAVAMVLGSVLLADRIHWSTAISLAVPFSCITVTLLSLAERARRNKASGLSR